MDFNFYISSDNGGRYRTNFDASGNECRASQLCCGGYTPGKPSVFPYLPPRGTPLPPPLPQSCPPRNREQRKNPASGIFLCSCCTRRTGLAPDYSMVE